jgi:hypothetical protein
MPPVRRGSSRYLLPAIFVSALFAFACGSVPEVSFTTDNLDASAPPEDSSVGPKPDAAPADAGADADAGDIDLEDIDDGSCVFPNGNATVSNKKKCDNCLKNKCCDFAIACGNNPECVKLFTCRVACAPNDDGDACRAKCVTDHDAGVSTATPLIDCSDDKCAKRETQKCL